MEDTEEGLAALIKQRLQRPTHCTFDNDLTSRAQRSKVKILTQISKQPDPLVDSSGDEYYSASEEVNVKKLQERRRYAKGKGRVQHDTYANESLPPHVHGSNNQSSKNVDKSTKSEKDPVNMVNLDGHFLQYESLFETEITHWDQYSDDGEEETFSVGKQFPTLLELCLQSKETQRIIQHLPSRMHGLVYNSKDAEEMTNAQIHWVKEVLDLTDPHKDSFISEVKAPRTCKSRQENIIHCPTTRNIFYMFLNENNDDEEFRLKNGTHTLPVSHLYMYMPSSQSTYTYMYGNEFKPSERIAFKAFTEALDLLLPSFLPNKRMSGGDHGSGYIDKILSVAVVNTKHIMARRWPNLTKSCFDEALAYVWWARGDVTRAINAFSSIINNEKMAKKKATYIIELGRLYRWFGLPERAGPQFQLVSVKSGSNSGNYDHEAVEIQSQVLTANSWDTGFLTGERAAKSAGEWQFVLLSPELPSVLAQAAVESFLCFHGGQLADKSKKVLEEALSLLKRLVEKHPRLYEHLVLVHSLLGRPDEVKKIFEELVNKFWMEQESLWHRIPGTEYSAGQNRDGQHGHGDNSRIPRAYQPFLDQVASDRGRVPELIKVIWRSQLCHPYFPVTPHHEEPMGSVVPVVDFQQENLHIRLSSSGHITMDGHMLFPPVRAIHLDPYTGSLVHSHPSTCTEPWENMLTFFQFGGDKIHHFMPTPVRVFEDANAKVEVNMAYSPKKSCLLGMATYMNYKGESVRLNLMEKIREARYKECLKVFSQMNMRVDRRILETMPDDWKEEADTLLKDYHDRGLHFDCKVILDAVKKKAYPPPLAPIPAGKEKSRKKKKVPTATLR